MSPHPRHPIEIVLLGALDTKAEEYTYVSGQLVNHGCRPLVVDVGVMGEAGFVAVVDRAQVAHSGGTDIEVLRENGDRGAAMVAMASGAAAVVAELHRQGRVAAVMAIGGSNIASVMAAVSARLPFGVPKLLVSTVAAGDTRPYVGITDLTLMYPVVDINGLNRISRRVLSNAAAACAGMASRGQSDDRAAPVVAATMFGVTTACGTHLRRALASTGIEVLTFHATGVGGRTMESLIRDGQVQAVADMTTTELADELAGGVCSAGPERLTAAAETGIPQVVSLGALDMVNFGPAATVPERYRGRLLHQHNPHVTLMRTSVEECRELGRRLAVRLNRSRGPTTVLVPTRGFSEISRPGQVFHDPTADAALIDELTGGLDSSIVVRRFDTDINDPQVAEAAVKILSDSLSGTT